MASIADFIEDGHIVHFRWDRDELHVAYVECPHEGKVSMCNRLRDFCVVNRYMNVYGSELNLGSVPVNGPITIAWIPVSGESDIDREFSGLWVIPVHDPDYVAEKLLVDSDEGDEDAAT